VIFCDFRLRRTFEEWIFAEITGDRSRQPAYEINWCCRASRKH